MGKEWDSFKGKSGRVADYAKVPEFNESEWKGTGYSGKKRPSYRVKSGGSLRSALAEMNSKGPPVTSGPFAIVTQSRPAGGLPGRFCYSCPPLHCNGGELMAELRHKDGFGPVIIL